MHTDDMTQVYSEIVFLDRIGSYSRDGTKIAVLGTIPLDSEWTRCCLTGYLTALPSNQRFTANEKRVLREAAERRLAGLP